MVALHAIDAIPRREKCAVCTLPLMFQLCFCVRLLCLRVGETREVSVELLALFACFYVRMSNWVINFCDDLPAVIFGFILVNYLGSLLVTILSGVS